MKTLKILIWVGIYGTLILFGTGYAEPEYSYLRYVAPPIMSFLWLASTLLEFREGRISFPGSGVSKEHDGVFWFRFAAVFKGLFSLSILFLLPH